ncbi:MAG: helix-hairpin-helix domain-containing protein [Bacteroidia bacterium]
MKKIIFQPQKWIIQSNLWIVFFALLFSYKVSSQEILSDEELEIDEKVEMNVENSDAVENSDYTNLFEILQAYHKNKLNLNTATANDLSDLQLLNNLQINNLLNHIRENGLLLSVYELQTIDGFSEEIIQKIIPYIRVGKVEEKNNFSLNKIFKYGKSQWTSAFEQTLEKSKGYLIPGKTSYLGSPQKIIERYKFQSSNFVSAGFTSKKDAGEEFFSGSQKQGFDFYSGYLSIKNNHFIKNIIVGDYQASFGQGLTTWTGFGFGKSSDVMNIAKSGAGIRPYTSLDEINFFRGIATTFAFKRFEISTFISDKKTDATIVPSLNEKDSLAVSSIKQGGLHRTITELQNKNSLQEKIFGGNITYQKNNFSIGLTALQTNFDKPIQKKNILYNAYDFSGKINTNAGINYGFSHRNFYFFGETAISQNGGFAYMNGILASLSPTVSFSVLHRNYSRDYQNFFSKGFSENTKTSNEKGIYFGIEMHPFSNFSISAFADYFQFPWLKYLVNAPSYGNDFLENASYTLSSSIKLSVKCRQHKRFKNMPSAGLINGILPISQNNYRFQIQYNARDFMEFMNRLEYVNYIQTNTVPSNGFLISQTIFLKKKNKPFSISLNYTLFQTDDYNSRIYFLENDFYNRYSISDFFYKGSSVSFSGKYELSKKIILSVRATQLFYQNKNNIGSGSDEISGNTKNTVAGQLQFSF